MRTGKTAVIIGLALLGLATSLQALYDWRWGEHHCIYDASNVVLTDRCGSRASDEAYLWDGNEYVLYARTVVDDADTIRVIHEDDEEYLRETQPDPGNVGSSPCITIGTNSTRDDVKMAVMWRTSSDDARFCAAPLTYAADDWPVQCDLSDGMTSDAMALAASRDFFFDWVFACYRANPSGDPTDGVWFRASKDMGENWEDAVQISEHEADQIALATPVLAPDRIYVAYHYMDGNTHKVALWRSTDNGETWNESDSSPWSGVAQPSIAASDRTYEEYAAICWVKADEGENPTEGGKVWACWSDDFFADISSPEAIGSYGTSASLVYNHPSIHMVHERTPGDDAPNLVVVSELHSSYLDGQWLSATSGGIFQDGFRWSGYPEHHIPAVPGVATSDANPCVVSYDPGLGGAGVQASCWWVDDGNGDDLYRTDASFVAIPPFVQVRPVQFDGTGGRLRAEPDGTLHYSARVGNNVHFGRALGSDYLQPLLVSGGGLPALALDGDGERWIAYWRDDTIWCAVPGDTAVALYEGTSATPPGQPSIEVYPLPDGSDYVAAITFAVYDSASEDCHIMFAKVKQGTVLLDTVYSNTSDFSDSFPSINVDSDSTLYVVWQSDGAVVERHKDFHVGCWTAHGSDWGSTTTICAEGGHPSSRAEGDVLHAVWGDVDNSGSPTTYSIKAKSYSFGGMWSGWQDDGTASEVDSRLKINPVYAGAGVSVWQEEVSSVWRLAGEVRGETLTFRASDSGSYHPHAVACSSAISPSIDQIRVNLLWTEGLIFEVDSAVYDTGETRFMCCSLNVSNAGANATEANNGRKLIRKAGSDSLFAVYSDADNAVMYARSANGDSWVREVVAEEADYPAICSDGTGRRHIVFRKLDGEYDIYACYDSAGTVSTPRSIVDLGSDNCGPISVVGSGDGSNSCAYAVYRYIPSSGDPSIRLVKFDASQEYGTTLYSGAAYGGDPCVAAEYDDGEEEDYLHLCFEKTDGDEVYYTMSNSGIDPAEFGSPTITFQEPTNVSNTAGDDSRHPVVDCDGERVVIAWAERTTSDILVIERDVEDDWDTFGDTVNVSSSAVTSEYPVLSVGDSIIVAWEERATGTDYDVKASVEYGTAFDLVNTDHTCNYPHVIFHNKPSGDSCIPYIKALWAEEPEESYYEVGYRWYNIKSEGSGGGGAQSGGRLLQPALYPNKPNPFRGRTQISYQLGVAGRVLLRVYDASGRAIRTLQDDWLKPGRYASSWDGHDGRGRQVPNGIYFYRLDAPGYSNVKKAVIMR